MAKIFRYSLGLNKLLFVWHVNVVPNQDIILRNASCSLNLIIKIFGQLIQAQSEKWQFPKCYIASGGQKGQLTLSGIKGKTTSFHWDVRASQSIVWILVMLPSVDLFLGTFFRLITLIVCFTGYLQMCKTNFVNFVIKYYLLHYFN